MSRETTLTDCGISTSGMSDLEAELPAVDTYFGAVTTTAPSSSLSLGAWSWADAAPAAAAPISTIKACLVSMAKSPLSSI
jgi:hypothetical protein